MLRNLYNRILIILYKIPYVGYFAIVTHVIVFSYVVRSRNVSNPNNLLMLSIKNFSLLIKVIYSTSICLLPGQDHKYIFVMYEPRFKKIIDRLDNDKVVVLMLDRGIFDHLFHKNLKSYLMEANRGFGEYALSIYERHPKDRGRYLFACQDFAIKLKKTFRKSSVVFPKYNDDYTLELIQSFSNSGWRTIVYDREGTVTIKRLESIPSIVSRLKVKCDVILTYNQNHNNFFQKVFLNSKGEIPSIRIMGNPASDEWFYNNKLVRPSEISLTNKRILFFAFGEFSYVYDAESLKGRSEVWRKLLTDIHDVFYSYLSDHSKDVLTYKRNAKGNRDYWIGSEKLLAKKNTILSEDSANSKELIINSDVVVAFQTTALIDAMHTNRIIIYCGWGDNYDELKNGLIDFEGYASAGAILYAKSPEVLYKLLCINPFEVYIDMTERKRIREMYTSNSDGKVSDRFSDWLHKDQGWQ